MNNLEQAWYRGTQISHLDNTLRPELHSEAIQKDTSIRLSMKDTSIQLAKASFYSMYSVSNTPVQPSAWSLLWKRRR